MAEKRRFLDVWIIESNTVYREVPYTVVADWVQQGRLLEDDMLRPSGTAEWFKVGAMPAFAAYLPKAEPMRVEDQAEALETVQVDFTWKKPHDDDEGDVDMIPLIDVSLVLLVFFMMTATASGIAALIKTPQTEYSNHGGGNNSILINVNLEGAGGDRVPVYSLSVGDAAPAANDSNIHSREIMLEHLDALLAERQGPVEVTINAHEDCESGLVRRITADLASPPRRDKILRKFTGVTEKVP
jgi:biopolymer transport protein ExbD